MAGEAGQSDYVRRAVAGFLLIAGVGIVARFVRRMGQPSLEQELREVRAARPKRDREFPNRFVPRESTPKPLPGCEDAVGGIESITIGGKRYWFGFAYRIDTVVSPLIDDARVMAQFGSDYMLQTSGAHPPELWEGLVKTAVDLSGLADDPADRAFTGLELSDALKEIGVATEERRPARLAVPDHLAYLLSATFKTEAHPRGPFPCGGTEGRAIRALSHYEDCLTGAMMVISRKKEPPRDTDYEDALNIVADYIDYWRRNVPENWRTLLLAG